MLSKYNINIENCCFFACFRLLIFIHFSRGSADHICPYVRTPRGLSRLLTRSAVFADDVVPSVGDVAESTVSRQVGHRQGVLADHQHSTDDRHTNTQTDTTDCCTPQTTSAQIETTATVMRTQLVAVWPRSPPIDPPRPPTSRSCAITTEQAVAMLMTSRRDHVTDRAMQ